MATGSDWSGRVGRWNECAPRPDGGVLALSFVTALIARPWKVGVRVRITCGNVPGAPPYSWQKLAECVIAEDHHRLLLVLDDGGKPRMLPETNPSYFSRQIGRASCRER